MNVETKEIHITSYDLKGMNASVNEAECFGWEKTDKIIRKGKSSYGIMIRDKEMPNYFEIIELEKEYYQLKEKLKTYEKADFTTYLLLFILLVIPFVLFLIFKILQKSHYEKHNEPILARMNEITKKAQELKNK